MIRHALLAATFLAGPAIASAQATIPPNGAGVKTEIVAELDEAQTKLVQLLGAIPAAKFGWRPAAGVRSFSEVYIHIIIENLEIPPLAGVPASPTVKLPPDAETNVTDKAAVLDFLTKSFAYAKQSVGAVPNAQLDAAANYFGTATTKRGVMIKLGSHGHEHLGQLIAYARMNAIVPPWSR